MNINFDCTLVGALNQDITYLGVCEMVQTIFMM